MDKLKVLQAMHDSEINAQLSWFWDSQFEWKLGDEMNDFIDQGNHDTLEGAINSLISAAILHYPESEFAISMKIPSKQF